MFVHAVVIASFVKVVLDKERAWKEKLLLVIKNLQTKRTHTHQTKLFYCHFGVLYSLLRCYNLLVLTGKAKRQPPKKV